MILISKDDSERLIEEFVVKLSKHNNSTELATQSMNILNDETYKKILLGCLLIDYRDKFKDVDDGEYDMRVAMFSAVNCIYDEDCDDDIMLPKFKGLFSSENEELSWNNPKLQFAFSQFVSAFYSCLLYTSPSPRDRQKSRMPSSA